MAGSAPMTAFFLDAAERAECVRNPEAFVSRSERVLGGLVQKLKRIEAERSVERVDMEQTYHQLERSHATLREDYQKMSAQHAQYGGERDTLIEARDGALGEAAKLRGQLRSKDLELSRLKEEAGEAAEERKRLLEANARKAQQLDALEKEAQQLRQQESGSRQLSTVEKPPSIPLHLPRAFRGNGGAPGHCHTLSRCLAPGGVPAPFLAPLSRHPCPTPLVPLTPVPRTLPLPLTVSQVPPPPLSVPRALRELV